VVFQSGGGGAGVFGSSVVFRFHTCSCFRRSVSWFLVTDLGMLLVHPLGGDIDGSEMEVMRGIVGAMDL
jgi:hypothetical protein